MRGLLILEILTNAVSYKLDEQSGLYNTHRLTGEIFPNAEPIGFYDILQTGANPRITKIKRTTDNIQFKIGDLIDTTDAKKVTLESFKFVKNKLLVNGNITIETISLWKEPVIQAKAKSGTKIIGNNFKELQDIIERDNRPIKLGNKTNPFDENKIANLKTDLALFLKMFITDYNNNNDTCYVDSGRVQTERAKRRSLADIYMICKYYYPNCTLHEVIQALYAELPLIFTGLGSLICKAINKRIWWDFKKPRFDEAEKADEFGNTQAYYITKLKEISKVEAVEDVLSTVKARYKPGIKFKIMSSKTGAITKVDSTEFYNGISAIILCKKDGSRKMVYDKVSRQFAKIVD